MIGQSKVKIDLDTIQYFCNQGSTDVCENVSIIFSHTKQLSRVKQNEKLLDHQHTESNKHSLNVIILKLPVRIVIL